MKKIIFLSLLAIGMIGCSVESMDPEALLTADAKFKIQNAVTITAPEGDLCVGETLAFSVNANTSSNFQVQQYVGDDWVQVFHANKGLEGTASFEVVLQEGENLFRTTGSRGFDDYPDSFVGVICNPCENLLVVELHCGETNTVTFTFTAEEAGPIVIQGGLTNATEIKSASSNLLISNQDHPSVTNSRANVTRWEGDIDACEVVIITIEFTGGNGIGDWSAKRGEGDDEEVLGTTEALECE